MPRIGLVIRPEWPPEQLRGYAAAVEAAGLDEVRLAWPPPEPVPLLVGARGPKTLALAGELADGLVLDASFTAAGVARAIAQSFAAQSFAAQSFAAPSFAAPSAARRAAEIVVYLPTGSAPGSAE